MRWRQHYDELQNRFEKSKKLDERIRQTHEAAWRYRHSPGGREKRREQKLKSRVRKRNASKSGPPDSSGFSSPSDSTVKQSPSPPSNACSRSKASRCHKDEKWLLGCQKTIARLLKQNVPPLPNEAVEFASSSNACKRSILKNENQLRERMKKICIPQSGGGGHQVNEKLLKSNFIPCSRPGCYETFPNDPRVDHKRFCSISCRDALRTVRQRLLNWFRLTGCESSFKLFFSFGGKLAGVG
jgi:hypothetical protein